MAQHLWKVITLNFLRSGGGEEDDDERRSAFVDDNENSNAGENDDDKKPAAAVDDDNDVIMGDSCSKMETDNDAKPAASDDAPPPAAAGSKRNRDGKFSSLRKSIFRVGSRIDRGGGNAFATGSSSDMNGVPHSPRARASTYSHVHDAVMYNLSEAETSKHDQSVPMG